MKPRLPPVVLLAILSTYARAQAPAPTAEKVQPLPADVAPSDGRSVVQQRMNNHGANLMELTLAVTLLQRKTIAEVATRIGSDTGLTATAPGATEKASQRNFRFLESVLRDRTATLAKASSGGDNTALATAFGDMMQVCISCHSLYLHKTGEGAPQPAKRPLR